MFAIFFLDNSGVCRVDGIRLIDVFECFGFFAEKVDSFLVENVLDVQTGSTLWIVDR